jgi:hypothetical protein
VQTELTYARGFGRHRKLSLDLSAAAAYDEYAGGMTAAWSAALSRSLGSNLKASAFAKGYFGPNGSDRYFGGNISVGF